MMEWSWPLFVRITRYDLGWSKACAGWHERLHPEQPKPTAAVVSVVAASVVVPAAQKSADGVAATAAAPAVARVAAVATKTTPTAVTAVTAKPTAVAVVSAPATAVAARPAAAVPVAAVAKTPVSAKAAPTAAVASVAAVAPVAAVAAAPLKGTALSVVGPAKTSPGLGLPQFLVMLEVPGGQVRAEIVQEPTPFLPLPPPCASGCRLAQR